MITERVNNLQMSDYYTLVNALDFRQSLEISELLD